MTKRETFARNLLGFDVVVINHAAGHWLRHHGCQ
jgi:hypothetical protein